jgi:hypothetical protein
MFWAKGEGKGRKAKGKRQRVKGKGQWNADGADLRGFQPYF